MKMRELLDAVWPRGGNSPLYLYNTLGLEKQRFELPPQAREVRMYNCGPTVYGRQHIGNLSMFVFTDVLRRVLEYNGFRVKQVINFTDFGHLSSDADEGEDKMTKGLKREGLAFTLDNMKALGEKYANLFLEDIRALNVRVEGTTFPRASGYISAQIAMIQTLEEKGYAYRTGQGVYFDTSHFPEYGKLGNIDLTGLKAGARVVSDPEKRSPTDFILWKSSGSGRSESEAGGPGDHVSAGDRLLGWESPWGMGFPGWHIECSAMIRATLGQQIDIHTGGIEHIAVHHNNEIAQSESATGKKPLSRFWMHRAHIQLEGGKMAKSEGNVVYLSDVVERGFHPLALRYLFLTAHYRTPSSFSWEALQAAQKAFSKLVALRLSLKDAKSGAAPRAWRKKFLARINDDLDTPGALALLWDMTKNKRLATQELLACLLDFDAVLGLRLEEPDEAARKLAQADMREVVPVEALPEATRAFVTEREEARKKKDWARADELRVLIESEGYGIKDTPEGARLYPNK